MVKLAHGTGARTSDNGDRNRQRRRTLLRKCAETSAGLVITSAADHCVGRICDPGFGRTRLIVGQGRTLVADRKLLNLFDLLEHSWPSLNRVGFALCLGDGSADHDSPIQPRCGNRFSWAEVAHLRDHRDAGWDVRGMASTGLLM